jgi:hypothetical protein
MMLTAADMRIANQRESTRHDGLAPSNATVCRNMKRHHRPFHETGSVIADACTHTPPRATHVPFHPPAPRTDE